MSDPVILAMIAGIAPTLAGIGTLVVSLRNSQKADASKVKTDEIVKKTKEIHVMVNSNLAEIKAKLASSEAHVKRLEELLLSFTGKKVN